MSVAPSFVLGLDFGTTSLKLCVLTVDKSVVLEKQLVHNTEYSLGMQDARRAIELAKTLIEDAVDELKGNIVHLAISGQMHGVVLWNGGKLGEGQIDCSPFYTWQYPSKSPDVLDQLSKLGPIDVYPGYGMATLVGLHRNGALKDTDWDRCGTIMDLFSAYLCQSDKCFIGSQNAHSWGCCQGERNWNNEIPLNLHILPEIITSGSILPETIKTISSLENATIGAAMGDLQAAVYPHIDKQTAVINIGTSAQICCIVPAGYVVPKHQSSLRIDPFTGDDHLLIAPSLNGGSALSAFVDLITSWNAEITNSPKGVADYAKIVERLNTNAEKSSQAEGTTLKVRPTFHGERGLPQLDGANITGIQPNANIYKVLQSLCDGVIDNLFTLLPLDLLRSLGVSRLRLTGSAHEPRFSNRIRRIVPDMQILHATVPTTAAYGAAAHAIDHILC